MVLNNGELHSRLHNSPHQEVTPGFERAYSIYKMRVHINVRVHNNVHSIYNVRIYNNVHIIYNVHKILMCILYTQCAYCMCTYLGVCAFTFIVDVYSYTRTIGIERKG